MPMIGDDTCESSWLEAIVSAHEDNGGPAFRTSSERVSGAELIGKAVCAGEFLTELEPALPDASVPALLTTNADALALLLGGAAAGRPIAPLGPLLATAELVSMVQRMKATVLLTEQRFASTASAVAAATGARVRVVPEFAHSGSRLPTPRHRTGFVLHTAGTTGAPKRVEFNDTVLNVRAQVLTELFGFGPDTTFATGSPIHHIGGLGNLLATIAAGGSAVAMDRFGPRWWAALAEMGVTHTLLVPAMIEILLEAGTLGAVPVKTLIYGAAPMRVSTVRRVMDTLPGVNLFNLYGQTEGSPIACLDTDDHRRALTQPDLLESVGRAVPGLRMKVEAPAVERIGEVLVAARHLAVSGPDGWLHTRDVGELDSGGYLRLRGRHNDMLVRGGENVYPVDVEGVLSQHPRVGSVGVVGVPDERLGETVAAFIVPTKTGDPPTADHLRTWSRERMAGFKVPTYWHFVDALPYNAGGKLLRRELRDWHLDSG